LNVPGRISLLLFCCFLGRSENIFESELRVLCVLAVR
jgi:hypothetical protein